MSTFFSVKVAFSFLQLSNDRKTLPEDVPASCPASYLYLIRVESLAKEEAARDISVSTIGFTTCQSNKVKMSYSCESSFVNASLCLTLDWQMLHLSLCFWSSL